MPSQSAPRRLWYGPLLAVLCRGSREVGSMRLTLLATALMFVFAPSYSSAQDAERLALDPTFGRRGAITTLGIVGRDVTELEAVTIDPQGRPVVIGRIYGSNDHVVARLLPSGQLDPQFGDGGISPVPIGPYVGSVALDPQDRIVAAGSEAVVRLLPDGTLDPQFADLGILSLNTYIFAARPLGLDGSLVVEHYVFPVGRSVIVRLFPDGTLDTAFGGGGEVALSQYPWIAAERTGGIVFCTASGIGRLRPDGSPDPSFGDGGILRGPLGGPLLPSYLLRIDGNGRIVVYGVEDGVLPSARLFRFLPDGKLDPQFPTARLSTELPGDSEAYDGSVLAVSQAGDDRIVVMSGLMFLGPQLRVGFGVGSFVQSFDPASPQAACRFVQRRPTGGNPVRMVFQDLALTPDGAAAYAVGFFGRRFGYRELRRGARKPLIARIDLTTSRSRPSPSLRVSWDDSVTAVLRDETASFSARLRVRNVGTARARNARVAVYLSADDVLDVNDVWLLELPTRSVRSSGVRGMRLPAMALAVPPGTASLDGQRLIAVVVRADVFRDSPEESTTAVAVVSQR